MQHLQMCDAPYCNGAALGRVVIDGVHRGNACSARCADRIGGVCVAPINAPLSTGELEAELRRLTARVAALEQIVGVNAARAPAAAAAAAPAAPAAPATASSALPIAVVTTRLTPSPDFVAVIQSLVPSRTVVEASIDKLVRGQRVVFVILAATQRSPTAPDTSNHLRRIIAATGVRPFLLIGTVFDVASERWSALDLVPRDEYDGTANFIFGVAGGGAFKRWTTAAPSAAQILST